MQHFIDFPDKSLLFLSYFGCMKCSVFTISISWIAKVLGTKSYKTTRPWLLIGIYGTFFRDATIYLIFTTSWLENSVTIFTNVSHGYFLSSLPIYECTVLLLVIVLFCLNSKGSSHTAEEDRPAFLCLWLVCRFCSPCLTVLLKNSTGCMSVSKLCWTAGVVRQSSSGDNYIITWNCSYMYVLYTKQHGVFPTEGLEEVLWLISV